MTDYGAVRRAMAAGTPLDLICGTCPWDRLCVRPPDMTTEQVKESVRQAVTASTSEPEGRSPASAALVEMTATAIYAGRDTMGLMCPVLAARLQSPDGRAVADGIRNLMRTHHVSGDQPPG